MHDELIRNLRNESKYALPSQTRKALIEAADAIEELQGRVKTLIRKLDEANQDADYANEAATALRGALPRWIPVTERLPENHQSVLVLRDDGGIFIWEYFDQTPTEECWIDDHLNLYSAYSITHWMPLPQPPKEET